MKTFITFILFITAILNCTAQTFASLVAYIYDKDNNTPILGASVIVKEAGWAAKTTGNDGKAFFDKSMPIGEINYIISKEGYQGQEGKFNITTEEKSNTLDIKLTKFQDDKLLITGEVVDENDKDVAGAIVEVKVANIIKTTESDLSGNYSIELTLNRTKYDVSTIKLEAKSPKNASNTCKKTEIIDLTRRNVIYKDFKLDCEKKEPKKRTLAITGSVKNEQDKALGGTSIRLKIGTTAREVRTDNYGNYSIDVVLDDNNYAITSIKIEAQFNEQCKKTEIIDITDKNIIYKDFYLACPEEAPIQKKEEDTVPEPDILKIKTDLIGRKIINKEKSFLWKFDYLNEYRSASIIKIERGIQRIEYHVKFLLRGEGETEDHETELYIVYKQYSEKGEWSLYEHRMLYYTETFIVPTDKWIKITPSSCCRYSFNNGKKLKWQTSEGVKFITGPDDEGIEFPNSSYYHVYSREETPVSLKFTYKL